MRRMTGSNDTGRLAALPHSIERQKEGQSPHGFPPWPKPNYSMRARLLLSAACRQCESNGSLVSYLSTGAYSPRNLMKMKGTIFEIVYRRLVSRLGHNQTIGAIAHRLSHLIWIILHQRVPYE